MGHIRAFEPRVLSIRVGFRVVHAVVSTTCYPHAGAIIGPRQKILGRPHVQGPDQ